MENEALLRLEAFNRLLEDAEVLTDKHIRLKNKVDTLSRYICEMAGRELSRVELDITDSELCALNKEIEANDEEMKSILNTALLLFSDYMNSDN